MNNKMLIIPSEVLRALWQISLSTRREYGGGIRFDDDGKLKQISIHPGAVDSVLFNLEKDVHVTFHTHSFVFNERLLHKEELLEMPLLLKELIYKYTTMFSTQDIITLLSTPQIDATMLFTPVKIIAAVKSKNRSANNVDARSVIFPYSSFRRAIIENEIPITIFQLNIYIAITRILFPGGDEMLPKLLRRAKLSVVMSDIYGAILGILKKVEVENKFVVRLDEIDGVARLASYMDDVKEFHDFIDKYDDESGNDEIFETYKYLKRANPLDNKLSIFSNEHLRVAMNDESIAGSYVFHFVLNLISSLLSFIVYIHGENSVMPPSIEPFMNMFLLTMTNPIFRDGNDIKTLKIGWMHARTTGLRKMADFKHIPDSAEKLRKDPEWSLLMNDIMISYSFLMAFDKFIISLVMLMISEKGIDSDTIIEPVNQILGLDFQKRFNAEDISKVATRFNLSREQIKEEIITYVLSSQYSAFFFNNYLLPINSFSYMEIKNVKKSDLILDLT